MNINQMNMTRNMPAFGNGAPDRYATAGELNATEKRIMKHQQELIEASEKRIMQHQQELFDKQNEAIAKTFYVLINQPKNTMYCQREINRSLSQIYPDIKNF